MNHPELRWGAATDAGLVREANEDAHLVAPPLFVVADGMGGHQAGEVASALAVDVLRTRLADIEITFDAMVDAVVEANRAIYATAAGNAAQLGMGTTITALALAIGDHRDVHGGISSSDDDGGDDTGDIDIGAIDDIGDNGDNGEGDNTAEGDDSGGHHHPTDGGEHTAVTDPTTATEIATDAATATAETSTNAYLVVINVGDSRTYRFRAGDLQRATLDHSYVQELINAGHLTDDEARLHPRRNIVTRALGIEADVVVDAWALPVVAGDRFVLCSDGLVDEVIDADIRDIVATTPDPQAAADRLVAAAIDNGGRDNITVVVVDVIARAASAAGATSNTAVADDGAATPADAETPDRPTSGTDPGTSPLDELRDEQPEPAPLDDDTGPIPAVVPPPPKPIDRAATPVIRPPATRPRRRGPLIAALIGIAVLVAIGVLVLLAITGDTASSSAPHRRADRATAATKLGVDTASTASVASAASAASAATAAAASHLHVDTAPVAPAESAESAASALAADDGGGMG